MSAAWSPHLPFGSLIATSGVDHHLSVLDARLMGTDSEKSVVWKVERAHGGHHHPAITSVKFNPFIPHWLASAGEDSIVRVWDLRYLKNPAAKIEGHYQGIQSMTWSNTHAEILVTGSSDCTFRAWCIDSTVITPVKSSRSVFVGSPATEWGDLRADTNASMRNINPNDSGLPEIPFCVGAKMISDVSMFSGPVVAVNASWSHLDTYYALSAVGEITSISLRPDLFKSTASHRFNAQEYPQESSIESAIYARDLTGAFEQVVQLSRNSLAERRTYGQYERKMIELCTAKEPISPASWAIANRGGVSLAGSLRKIVGPWKDEGKEGGKEMVERFRMDLETYSYFLPPRFGEFKRWYELIPAKTRLELEMVILRFNILVDVSKRNWENVLKAEEMVCKGIQSDPTFMEPDYLKLLIESVIPNDFSRGLSMGHKLVQEVERSGSSSVPSRFPRLSGLIGLLLFPTVFESATWITDPSNLERKWVEGRGPRMRQIWVRGFLDDEHKKTIEKGNSKGSTQPKVQKRRGGEIVQEDDERKKTSAIEALLSDPAAVLNMISTEIKVLKTLIKSTSNDDIAENLIQIITGEDEAMNTKGEVAAASMVTSKSNEVLHESKANNLNMAGIKYAYRPTISSTTNRLYMDSLLLTKRFEEYFTLCNDFCVSYQSFEFPKSILRHAELTAIPKLKAHTDALLAKSAAHISEANQMAEKAVSSVIGQTMTGGTKPLREGLGTVVKIAVVLAQMVEAKGILEKEGVEIIARCVVPLTNMLNLLSGSLFKILEQMEKLFGKLGSAGAYARDAASLTQEDIRQLCRGYSKPSEAKTRATATIVSTATGANARDSGSAAALMEEVFIIIDKLGKVSKPQT
ncbi:UNVERIFIED_CONTAM: hypothetical protein HDU68_009406 [Siphonaria sp. JEL0065]|nr:hypothetical protein HDU68_009406 [Siphonaria sp. JEL0065]